MAKSYDVAIRVISQRGTCEAGHRSGDEWVIRGEESKTPGGICLSAFNSFYPCLTVLMYGGAFPWESDPDMTTAACPDAGNPVVFELRRVRK